MYYIYMKSVKFQIMMASTKRDSFFFKDLLQRKYVEHVQGQVTKLFHQPVRINIYTMTQRINIYTMTQVKQK